MVNEQFRRGVATPRRSRMAYYTRRRQHRLGVTSTDSGFKAVSPQFMRRVRNRPALRQRGWLHAMIRSIAVVGALVGAYYGAQYGYEKALTSPALSIQSVRLHQVPTMLIEPVRARVQPAYGKNLLALDLAALRASIEELPAVRSAGVRRLLPDALLVSVEARVPRARIIGEQDTFVIDRDGVALDTYGPVGGRLAEIRIADGGTLTAEPGVQLTRDESHGDSVVAALGVLDWISQSDGELPHTIRHLRIEDGAVVLVSSRFEIIVGDAEELDAKMAAVRSLLRADPPAEPSTIDARYKDMLVVTAMPKEAE